MTLTLAQIASSFIAPALAAAGVAAVAIPIAIHLLSRLRRKRQRWGAMRFLRLAYQKQKNRLRLEQWLLLATRCLLVLLIGLALAGPVVGGWLAAWASGGAAGGRTVHIVLDDALATRALDGSGAMRFEALRGEARELVGALGPGDRVALWTPHHQGGDAERPVATVDHAAALRRLNRHVPAFVAADWAQTMEAIADELGRGNTGADSTLVVVLSDFVRGDDTLTEPAPSGLTALGASAAVMVRRPALSTPNRQVTSVTPRRRVVLADEVTGRALDVAVEATRFGDPAEPASGELVAELLEPGGASAFRVAATVLHPVRWATGQQRVTTTVSVPRPELPPAVERRDYTLRVTLRSGPGVDALPADDARLDVVRVQRAWRVGLMDDINALSGDGLTPGRFVAAALEGPGVEVEPLSTLNAAALEPLSAVFVLAPQRLDESGWSALSAFARDGGVVWLTPPTDAEASLVWLNRARRAFELAWEPGDGVRILQEPARLDTERTAPPALSLLAGDWARLLGPVRVDRVVPLDRVLDEGWLWIDAPDGATPLLAVRRVGLGAMVLQGVAVDPAWSNLPTKPVFPALVQDGLRSALGPGLADRVWVSGQTPTVRGDLEGHRDFAFAGGAGIQADPEAIGEAGKPSTLRLVSADGASVSRDTPFWPGVYRPQAEGGLPQLVVNVEAGAADTTALSEAELTAWWDAVGRWTWLPDDASAALDTEAPRVNLGWWLLWGVLVLVILETWLSRAFSHAGTQTAPLGTRVASVLRHLRHSEAGDRWGRKAA